MFKRKASLLIVIATRQPQVPEALDAALAHLGAVRLERREALSCSGAYRALAGAHLAIVDPTDLTTDAAAPALEAALQSPCLVAVASAAFLADPLHYLEAAAAAPGVAAVLPPRCVAFTALAGGVGKTTLALAAALAFHRATGLPAAVIEASLGPSALLAVTETEGADVYRVLTQGAPYPVWRGVTLAPLAWDTARLLPPEQVRAAWETLAAQHVFTACDAPAWQPLYEHLPATQALVLADHRPDAQAAAVALLARWRTEGYPAALGLNRAGLGGRWAMPEKPVLALPAVRNPLTLGAQILPAFYPGWRAQGGRGKSA